METLLERSGTVADERILLARARSLDPEALAELHERYYRMLYFYVLGRVGERAVAEDVTAEVFIRLLEAFHQGRGPERHLVAWLFRTADHVVADHHRARYRHPEVPLEEEWGSLREEEWEDVVLRERVREALHHLTPDQRAVILMRFWMDLPLARIAQELGKSVGAVKLLQHRALAALAKRLRDLRDDHGQA
ncbi:ECF RNA polymerase sigma factor SigX [Candidatus Thermoflexus japonica]|uniref:ECF RNA polymerase sigma factor SigX n=1 Tax=Candidatus Thermoflexus japonica TaxID=2035417 RepID=A0A2H5Y4Y7_9CHLR|nr:ECF RNA polymerase sigma factor SigX [Candidatus Thermoflexus japonica]